jgi:hypothetical protein
MASLRYAEGLGLDIPEANTATEIHLDIIYKIVFFSYLYMFIYIFVGWRVLGLLGVHPRLIVGRFNRNAPATYGISSFFQFVGPFPSANSGSIYMWVSINGVTVPQARWMITISLFRGKSNRKWMMTRGTPMSGNLHIPLYNFWLVVSTPLKNMSSSVGIMKFPIYGKRKYMFQTTNQYIMLLYDQSIWARAFPVDRQLCGLPCRPLHRCPGLL